MSRVIAICNQKGGVAKTTTCLSLGACLVEAGHSTLIVDLDPQSNLSIASGVGEDSEQSSITDLLSAASSGGQIDDQEAIHPTNYPGLDLLSADTGLAVLEREVYEVAGYETLLSNLLRSFQNRYEYILLDCSPSLGSLTIMALTAAHRVVVPVHCDYLAAWGVIRLVETIDAVRERTNPGLDYDLLVTMYDRRNSISQEVLSRLKERFEGHLYETMIGVDTRLRESVVNGEPVISYAPRTRASLQYRAMAQEILQKFNHGAVS